MEGFPIITHPAGFPTPSPPKLTPQTALAAAAAPGLAARAHRPPLPAAAPPPPAPPRPAPRRDTARPRCQPAPPQQSQRAHRAAMPMHAAARSGRTATQPRRHRMPGEPALRAQVLQLTYIEGAAAGSGARCCSRHR
eukprot:363437-Chlamydomonas_euryale.AAC.15